ncbi:NAD(P)/FAD-dependent oxidoreductase [Spirillospora sp. CA-128828]|uniref:NAD(P)/FAD-dependent oxidoreductase n=1 Tax=Spirillospora sp. CA-128828 TaxID=3240033 RepID=UPI003D8F0488
MSNEHQIVILGAGYSGMMCAIRLAHRTRRRSVRITLVNPSARFTERLRLHQVAAGQELADLQIPDLLHGTGVVFKRGRATSIDPAGRTVTLDETEILHYDRLVYALGSSTDTSIVPGADDHAFTLNGPAEARRFAARLDELTDAQGAVTVCGGGLTGIEAAAEIAEGRPGLAVTLISRDVPGTMMGEKARAYLHRALERIGVQLVVGAGAAKVLPGRIELEDGRVVPSDACLWTAGVKVPTLAADAGIDTDDRGLITVDGTLRSVSHPEVHAIGDTAAIGQAWGQIHGTCQSGMPTGAYTADAIARLLQGKKVKPFRFGYFHQPVSIGRRDGVVQFTHADDTPRRTYLKGRAAVFYKETVSGSPPKMYRMSKHFNVTPQLSKGGRVTRRAVL